MHAHVRLFVWVYALFTGLVLFSLSLTTALNTLEQLRRLPASAVPQHAQQLTVCAPWLALPVSWISREQSRWQLACDDSGQPLAQLRDSKPQRALPLLPLLGEQLWHTWGDQWLLVITFGLVPLWLSTSMRSRQTGFERRARALADTMAERSGISPQRRAAEPLSVLESTFSRLHDRLQAHRDEIARAEYADRLTGLANRYQFQQALEQSFNNAREENYVMALLFIDLDGFKQVNDSFGHSMGDALLVRVAERLRAAIRASDLLAKGEEADKAKESKGLGELARLGGDEFTVILSAINEPEAASRVAQRIIESLEVPFEVGGTTLQISSSIGVAVYPEDGDNPELLLQKADMAMYRAKADGKGIYRRYAADMGRQVIRQHYLSLELRKALDQSQFRLDWQPIVELPGNQVRYFEALLRWEHPLEGLISPAEFIPIAEENRQILAMGDWVLDAAMEQMARWQKAGLRKARVSINVSSVQIRNRDLHQWIMDAIRRFGVNPRGVMMEITESCLIEAHPETFEQLAALRKDGVHIALDDFGTGYSSLSVLASLPIDVIKVDSSFVNKAATDNKYREVLASVVQLAKQLNLELVAEGVENAAELELLQGLGCNLIQGYLISRPTSQTALNHELLHRQLANLSSLGTGVWPPGGSLG